MSDLVGNPEDRFSRITAHIKPVNIVSNRKVQVGNDQEKAQSEKDSHSKNRGGKKTKQSGTPQSRVESGSNSNSSKMLW